MAIQNTVPQNEMHVIVRFTNRTDFDFTPEMGARYGGQPFYIQAGKSILAPKPIAAYLARNLARQTFIRSAPVRDGSETDGKGTDRALWTPEDVARVQAKFLAEEYEEEKAVPKTEAELMAEKVATLNKDMDIKAPTTGYADKAEVMAELDKRGIKHDKRSSKDKLEELLK